MHDVAHIAPDHRARLMASAVLRACRSGSTQAAIAVAMGTSESTVSTMLSKELDRFCLLLACAGKKIVDADARCHPQKVWDALQTLAGVGVGKLRFDEEDPE